MPEPVDRFDAASATEEWLHSQNLSSGQLKLEDRSGEMVDARHKSDCAWIAITPPFSTCCIRTESLGPGGRDD